MDVLGLLSLFICVISLLIGFLKPKTSALFVLITTPILSPGRLVLVPSIALPLEYIIFAFSLSAGVALSPSFRKRIKDISYNDFRWILAVALMILLLLLTSDSEFISTVLFLDFTTYFVGIIIPLFLINSYKDLEILSKILIWQGALVGFFALLSYLDLFRFEYWLRLTVPDYNVEILQDVERAGLKRVHGLDGSASQTASRLVFLFFISFWYAVKRNNFTYYVPPLLIFMGLILLQTRAAFVALFVGFFFLFFALGQRKLINTKMVYVVIVSSISFLVLLLFIPFLRNILVTFFIDYLIPSITTGNTSVDVKIDRIPIAIDYAFQNLFSGYGSRERVYYDIMLTQDLPTPLIYLLSGGIGLFTMLLIVYLLPIFKTYRLKGNRILNNNEKRYMAFISTALLVGFIMTLSNWLETHRMIMIMTFIGSMKYFSLLKHEQRYLSGFNHG